MPHYNLDDQINKAPRWLRRRLSSIESHSKPSKKEGEIRCNKSIIEMNEDELQEYFKRYER